MSKPDSRETAYEFWNLLLKVETGEPLCTAAGNVGSLEVSSRLGKLRAAWAACTPEEQKAFLDELP